MDEIENANKQIHNTVNTTSDINQQRRSQRQRRSPSPKTRSTTTTTNNNNQLASLDLRYSAQSNNKNATAAALTLPTVPPVIPGAGNSNSLPGHQSGRLKQNINKILEKDELNLCDNSNSPGASGDHDINNSTSLSRKKNLSTSDIDPIERKKQAALAKVESKLEKAQRLREKAQQSVEQEISEFLRATTIPNSTNESNTPKITNAAFDKRIKALQETKRELEKKITNYRADISRIQAGDIPMNYTTSKDIFSNIKSTAAKVASGSLKYRPTNTNDQSGSISTPSSIEQQIFQSSDSDFNQNNSNLSPTTLPPSVNIAGVTNNNQNLLFQNQVGNTNDVTHSSLSSSASNDIGNSQFYIDANFDHVYDNDKSSRKIDTNIPADTSTTHDHDKSPGRQRRLTDDSNVESNDRISDHSADDRYASSTSKRNTSITTTEHQQLNTKVESMQKLIDRYENKFNEFQKQIDSLIQANSNQYEQNERLNDDLSDLMNLHQTEMTTMKNDLKNLEERLVYKFNDYWNELLEKLDKLDTRTAKVEQTQTHSFETEENTHRIISKLVNILLTVFAIILLILSTIKNVIQSRVHAMTLLIIVLSWLAFHYLPPNYFQTPFLRNFFKMFKRTSRNNTAE